MQCELSRPLFRTVATTGLNEEECEIVEYAASRRAVEVYDRHIGPLENTIGAVQAAVEMYEKLIAYTACKECAAAYNPRDPEQMKPVRITLQMHPDNAEHNDGPVHMASLTFLRGFRYKLQDARIVCMNLN